MGQPDRAIVGLNRERLRLPSESSERLVQAARLRGLPVSRAARDREPCGGPAARELLEVHVDGDKPVVQEDRKLGVGMLPPEIPHVLLRAQRAVLLPADPGDGAQLALLVGHELGPDGDDPDTATDPLEGGVADKRTLLVNHCHHRPTVGLAEVKLLTPWKVAFSHGRGHLDPSDSPPQWAQ